MTVCVCACTDENEHGHVHVHVHVHEHEHAHVPVPVQPPCCCFSLIQPATSPVPRHFARLRPYRQPRLQLWAALECLLLMMKPPAMVAAAVTAPGLVDIIAAAATTPSSHQCVICHQPDAMSNTTTPVQLADMTCSVSCTPRSDIPWCMAVQF
jgi:hypothetical protein